MTTTDERFRALKAGKKLLEELCDPGKTPRVPGIIRDRAMNVLRHYPGEQEFNDLASNSPEILNNKPAAVKSRVTTT